MSSSHIAGIVVALITLAVVLVVVGTPAYVVGRRRRVQNPGMAFVPLFGPYIVMLESIRRSGWLCLLAVVPFFQVWLVCVVPGEHRRSRWWILPFLIPGVNCIAFYVYAFTLEQRPERPVFAPRDPNEGIPGLRQYQYVPLRSGETRGGPPATASAGPGPPKDLFSPPAEA